MLEQDTHFSVCMHVGDLPLPYTISGVSSGYHSAEKRDYTYIQEGKAGFYVSV